MAFNTDITPDGQSRFDESINAIPFLFSDKNIDVIVGVESRGFIFGVPLAMELGAAFVPVRKPGKLPADVSDKYTLEYGSGALARMQMHPTWPTRSDSG